MGCIRILIFPESKGFFNFEGFYKFLYVILFIYYLIKYLFIDSLNNNIMYGNFIKNCVYMRIFYFCF